MSGLAAARAHRRSPLPPAGAAGPGAGRGGGRRGGDRIAFRYVDARGEPSAEANPNGSADSIAGVLSANRRVLGTMPHPERLADRQLGGADGALLFDSLCAVLAAPISPPTPSGRGAGGEAATAPPGAAPPRQSHGGPRS